MKGIFFRKKLANKHYYIFTIFISLLLLFPSKVVSQTSNASSPPDDDLPNRGTYRFSPATSIIFVVVVVIFFVIGCFSVFARRCMEAGSQRSGLLMINGDNQRSRRAMRGLDSNVIETFPTFLYSDVKKVKRVGVLECAICLNEFKDEENLRLIPKCCHVFHPECIDTWLVSRSTCPVCRADLVPVPGETGTNSNCNISSLGLEEDGTAHPAWLDDGRGQVREVNDTIIELDSGSQKKKFEGKYPRSHSTGHSLIKPRNDNNYERFTLRLSQDLQKKLMKPELRRAKSTIVFPRASSSKKGYRSSSVGPGLPIHNIYEQFNHEVRQDRWVFTMAPPFFTRSRSAQTPITGGDSGENNIMASGSSSRPVKSPFEWLFGGSSRKDDEAGERSSARLMGNDKV